MLGGKGEKLGLTQGGVLTGAGGSAIMLGLMTALKVSELTAQVIKTNSTEARISRANEDKIQAVAQAKEAKQKYDNFLTSATQQNAAVNKLTELQKGTTAYTTQLIESNNQARELIETYNLKAGQDYTVDSVTGIISMTAKQVNEVNERLLQENLEASTRAQIATSKFTQLTLAQQLSNINNELALIDMQRNPYAYGGETYQYYWGDTSDEHIQELREEKEEIELQQQADYQAAVASILSSKENATAKDRIAADILNVNSDYYGALYAQAMQQAEAWGGETHRATGAYRSIRKLRQLYKQYLGEEPSADLSQGELAAAIESAKAEKVIEEQFDAVFKDISDKDLQAFTQFDNYTSFSNQALMDLLNDESVKNSMNEETKKAYTALLEAVMQNRANAMDTLVNTLLSSTEFEGEDLNTKV